MSNLCTICPRKCNVDRSKSVGYCGETDKIRIARADLHQWEEPCISGENGSGTVFFSGCNLKCVFCQNFEISAQNKGFELNENQLAQTFLILQSKGAHNINLVNPTHFVSQIIQALKLCKNELKIPVVYNSGGYENVETIRNLADYVNIFLPDLKYYDSTLSQKYSNAADYFKKASQAIKVMFELVGKPKFDDSGMMKSGVIVRHLILPSCRHDSIALMNWLGESFKNDEVLISLMSQFTPVYKAKSFKELNRRLTTFEYNSVINALEKFGFDGFIQQKSSATTEYIPDFFEKIYF